MATLQTPLLTEDEYLRLERAAEFKSEFHDGRMFAMSGGSPNHSLIEGRMGMLLGQQVPPGCRVFTSNMRINIPSSRTYAYSDGCVVCGEPEFSSDQQDNILNPVVIVEVLSPSSENYDRGKKFEIYRRIASFREYLIVHQDQRRVEHYSRQDDGSWLLREHSGNDDCVTIARLGVKVALSELYATALNLE
jgi:Uma2 family endonuclease